MKKARCPHPLYDVAHAFSLMLKPCLSKQKRCVDLSKASL